MKIELNHKELGDAIALYLKAKLMDKTTFTVNVTRAESLPRHDKDAPAKWKITAEAVAVGTDNPLKELKERLEDEAA
jgi:hypothetical protein